MTHDELLAIAIKHCRQEPISVDGKMTRAWSQMSVMQALVEVERATMQRCADLVRENKHVSGGPGPLFSMGWDHAVDNSAAAIRAAFGEGG